jgi:hypothetical protein
VLSIQDELPRAGEREPEGNAWRENGCAAVAGYRRAAQILSHGLEQAQRWVGASLLRQGFGAQGGLMDTEALSGSDARKVALAKFLRERTTVP